MDNCTICGVKKKKVYKYGIKDDLCYECLCRLSEKPNICPGCGEVVDNHESVCLVLTPKGSTQEEKKKAKTVAVAVCPKCRVVFFDEVAYNILQGIKRNVA